MRFAACILFALSTLIFQCSATAAPTGNDLVHATLVSDVSKIYPGNPFKIGVLLKIEPGWHVYWQNPGDSGLPTKVTLKVPAGYVVGNIQYPLPAKQVSSEATNYVYENEVMLIAEITPPKDLSADSAPIDITANISWLVCKESCLPGKTSLSMQIPISNSMGFANGDLFSKWLPTLPTSVDQAMVNTVVSNSTETSKGAGHSRSLSIAVLWKVVPTNIEWLPIAGSDVMVNNPKIVESGNATRITCNLESTGKSDETLIDSIVAYTRADGTRAGLQIPAPK